LPSLVLDASVLVDALRPDARGSQAIRGRLKEADSWFAPHSIDVECMSAWRALRLRGEIDDHALARALDGLATWPIERLATTWLIPRIHELSPTVTPYDGAYVAIAEALALPLLTRDARLARASGPRCQFELI
jgi:predicted nucleic acid-binding protein